MIHTAFGYDGSVRIKADLNHSNFDRGLTSLEKQVDGFGATLKKLAGVVGLAFGTAAIVNFGKEAVKAASALNDAWIGLESIVEGQGKSFSKAKHFINDYISDGLVPLENAVTAYKNLAARGYSTEQIEKTMTALKDAAAFGRQASYSLGDAISTATEGLKNENSILVDNAGVTKNVAKMWDEYAKSIGTTANNLTQAQKIQAEVNGILEETRFQTGDAAKLVNTYSGQLAMLGYNFQQLKVEIGNALIPLAQAVLPGINAIITALVKLANVFAQVTKILFGKTNEVKTENNVASSANSAASATDKLAESTAGAGSAAKKAEKDMKGVLASFDELNILADNTASSLEDAAGGLDFGDAGIELPEVDTSGEIFGDVTVNPNLEKQIQKIVDKVKKLQEIAKKGFKLGFGNTDLTELQEDLQKIGGYLRDIFTDEDVRAAANRFIESFAYMIGSLAGSLASIGVTIATALVGGLEKYLSKNVERIKQWLIRMFDVWTEINYMIAEFAAAFADIFSVFGEDTSQEIVASIIQIFTDIFGGALEIASKFARDIIDAITAPFIENKDLIKETLRGFLEPIQKIMEDIANAVRTTVEGIVGLYDEHIHPFIMSVKESFTEWFEHALNGFNTYIKPVLDDFAKQLDDTINNHVVPMIEKAIEFFGNLYDTIKLLWDNIISPLVTFIVDIAAPAIATVMQDMKNRLTTFFNLVSDIMGAFYKALSGIIEFLTGVFTGDWDSAWKGIGKIFSGVWDGMTALVKNFIGFIGEALDGIGDFIDRIGDLYDRYKNMFNPIATAGKNAMDGKRAAVQTVPGISAYNLPHLANGAVIPPNQQFAAILGDQRSGTNIEAPAALIKEMVSQAMRETQGLSGNITIEIPVNLDGKTVARVIVPHINDMSRQAGKPVLLY